MTKLLRVGIIGLGRRWQKRYRPALLELRDRFEARVLCDEIYQRAINEAWADYNKSVPKAKGEAEQALREAEGYALERVNNAEGDASRFEALYEEYRKAPAVTRKRIYLETLAQVLPKLQRKVVVDENARGVLPLLSLDKAAKEVKP